TEAACDVVLVLEEQRAVGRQFSVGSGVDIGGARQTGSEGQGRHQVREFVGEVLAHHVLIELLLIATMSPELQGGLAVEYRAGDLIRNELELDRHELARLRAQPEVTAGAELDGDVRTIQGECSRKAYRVVRRALPVDRREIGSEPEAQRS